MARREFPPELLQEVRDLAAGWGKIMARRACGEGGPGLDTDFEAMEQLARADAAFALSLAGLPISPQHVRTLAQEVGDDLARQRDAKAARGRRRLPVRVAQTPALVAVEVDGGRLRTRQAGSGRGVHGQENKEDKVACLVTLQGEAHAQDP